MNFQRQIDGFPNIGTSHKKALEYRANKERAYSEGFAEFINTAERYYLAGKEYFVHPNVNLYLDMTAYCSSDCQFCIAKTTYERNNIPKYEYEESLHRALDVLRDVEPSIQIVGGEPTTDIGKLELILSVIKERNIKRPVLGTNGYWLFHLTGCINDGTLEYLNLSRHHYRDDINEEIMGGNVTCTDDLADDIYNLPERIRPRLQCNLIAGYIDSYCEVLRFIGYSLNELRIDNIAFSQLTPLPRNNIYRDEIIDYVESRQVDIDKILQQVDDNPSFKFLKYRGGVACYYEIWEYTGMHKPITVLFKFSNNEWLVRADRMENYIPDLILHTDGTLAGSWDKNCKVILEAI